MLNLLWAFAAILFVLWILGFATAYTAHGLIHVLLIAAIIAVAIRLIVGRRA